MHVVSDIHLDHRPQLYELPVTDAQYLALPGDIAQLKPQSLSTYRHFLQTICKRYKMVFIVCGNHEFFGSIFPGAIDLLRELCASIGNVMVLEKDYYDIPDTSWRVMGCTLWGSIPPEHVLQLTMQLNDFVLIMIDDQGHRFTVARSNQEHDARDAWIKSQLDECKRIGKKAVIITHHCPFYESKPTPSNGMTCGYCSDLTSLMDPTVIRMWLYGHTHRSRRKDINGVPVISNQCGYPDRKRPDTKYDPSFTISL